MISVVMAAKNYGQFIAEAVTSVVSQTMTDWELIIIDDGSVDTTAAIVKPFLKDRRIQYHRSDRLGQSRAKNLGIGLSRGEFVAFLDADDVWEPCKLEKQWPLFVNGIDVVYSRRSMIDDKSMPVSFQDPVKYRGAILSELFVQNVICFSSAVARRSLFERVGCFDESLDLAIDYDFWLRAAQVTRFDYVDEPLVRYRTGHANLSKRLVDRVDIACTVMDRACRRGGVSEDAQAAGYGSTLQTLSYVQRQDEPRQAMALAWQALRWPYRRWVSVKSLIAAQLAMFKKPRLKLDENALVNR